QAHLQRLRAQSIVPAVAPAAFPPLDLGGLLDEAEALFHDLERPADAPGGDRSMPGRYLWAAAAAALAALASLLTARKALPAQAWQPAAEGSRATRHERQTSERAQQAVRRLLHELGVVAQGDLSVRANENEPPTRAVAQAVNEALTELRRRCGCIADASARLATACAEARMAGGEMLNADRESVV